ncbi:MAG: SPOR domain-containing protein [Sphingobacteriales bacterium]|nr:MAG: SPOR domain-containing protein [Sphingobacteriales bacterium]
MKPSCLTIVIFLLLFHSFKSGAQQAYARDSTGVIVFEDPRLEQITAALRPKSSITGSGSSASGRSGVIRSGRGYRVQIYNGNDRKKATEIKVSFMRRFPNVRTYMTYIQPQFRVKVGDFTSRGEAQRFSQQLTGLYSTVMIVPDIIVINTFRND